MRTALEHLSSEQKNALSALIKTIASTIAIDKIICYGAKVNKQYNRSCCNMESFNKSTSTVTVHLLLIPGKEEKYPFHNIIQFADTLNTSELSITCLVHSAAAVTDAISHAHLFFTALFRNGHILYGENWENIPSLSTQLHLKDRLNNAVSIWNNHFTRAQNLLKGAAFYLNDEIPEYCVFSLHLAIEQTAIALLHSLTGYRPASRNIARLLPLMEYTGINMDPIFPQNTPEEKELFTTFKTSYSNIRYKDDFHIPLEVAAILYNRTKELIRQAQAIFLYESEKWHAQLQAELQTSPPVNITIFNPLHKAA